MGKSKQYSIPLKIEVTSILLLDLKPLILKPMLVYMYVISFLPSPQLIEAIDLII